MTSDTPEPLRRPSLPELPVSAVLPDVAAALAENGLAVLSAPPGAGKTTLVPLFLLDAPWRGEAGRILLLEPRRLAARAAAARMAGLLGEPVGATVGTRMRLDSRISARTRIEVVTEGVFARMILDDPELKGVAAVLFDEFHERSLDADLGLALALECREALRPDLRLLVMSATLDVDGVAALLGDPPVIESHGRSFPVEIAHQDRRPDERIEDAVTRTILSALESQEGSVLVFLPGQAEILRVAERLDGRLAPDVAVTPLYGALGQSEQDAAIRPAPSGRRKVVLATSIAETSITIDGVRIVIDSGLQRLPVFEPATGITRLETVRVSRASADQRAGRAGRTQAGVAIRLWHSGQTAALPAFTPPEILSSDLSRLALDLAEWGVSDPSTLSFLDPPPAPSWAEARALLQRIGALDGEGRMTARGRAMRALALPPRLAAMVAGAAEDGYGLSASRLAVLLTEQGLGGPAIDLDERLSRWRNERGARASAASGLAERMAQQAGATRDTAAAPGAGVLLLDAFPDRIALARGKTGAFVMANGRGAELPETERLARAPMLVIADLTGKAAGQRILAAAAISRAEIEASRPELITKGEEVFFDRAAKAVRARRVVRIGAAVLEEVPLPRPQGPAVAMALAEGLRQIGLSALPFSKEALHLRERLDFLFRTLGDPWPAVDDAALLDRLDDWFVPFQGETTSIDALRPGALSEGLASLVPTDLQRRMGELAPTHFEAPTGQRHPIHYDGEEPTLSIRVQELYGLTRHPTIGGGRRPLLLELLSPAHRPIQTTRDLPGFWAGSWKDVRAEMRGRYPKHPWPEDPAAAQPTTRVKPRGT
ncbi:ATP-dependent helicase HrpB [Rhizobium rhizosphaerae]|uniref:ATP-dependent helicase HrpB n=1 Tax=Xaviernesmea rhizosphaerae TaxID=1672749 RepID=A0A1Q9AGI2_9HYPH|nr:ATP-dependent helicase HrpB [Xaviernesmea rhizosphaerae]OLP54090.1 ATP-dependent helicase HrpB [Xaviernesmea rhizosphaerae]